MVQRVVCLSELPESARAIVHSAAPDRASDAIARRLCDLGFVAGEHVQVVARGPIGGDPLLVQIGHTRFALHRREAARVAVTMEAES